MKKNRWHRLTGGLIYCILFCSCVTDKNTTLSDVSLISQWGDMALYIAQYTPANTPTYAARTLGYIGLTMYECIVDMDDRYQSVFKQLHHTDTFYLPARNDRIHYQAALCAGQATIIKFMYPQTSDGNNRRIDSLAQSFYKLFRKNGIDQSTITRSIAYGEAIAEVIYQWSLNDGGNRAYLKNFDKTFQRESTPGSWHPALFSQSFSHNPLHPYWGDNRTFLRENHEVIKPLFLSYDSIYGSAYHKQFKVVYEVEQNLTQEQKEIAIWWSDDPDDTFTPGGHSYYIGLRLIEQEGLDLLGGSMMMARIGIAIADAYIKCWEWKYLYFSERPNSFISEHIDREWESFWPDPPFPAFPSGHSIQAGASATVMIDMLGDNISFTDRAHEGRERDKVRSVDFVPRQYNSIWSIAQETAESRLLGGIHIPYDNEVGLSKGAEIATNVIRLAWLKDD